MSMRIAPGSTKQCFLQPIVSSFDESTKRVLLAIKSITLLLWQQVGHIIRTTFNIFLLARTVGRENQTLMIKPLQSNGRIAYDSMVCVV